MAAKVEQTRFADRMRASLREELLTAATELLPSNGFRGLRMVDVAAATGVSRQTLYNEFGSKEALVEAVALRTAAEFLDGIGARLNAAPDVLTGLRTALAFALRHAEENTLVASVLGAGEARDLLPFLTSRSLPVLRPIAELIAGNLRERLPEIDDAQAELVAENAARLAFSHVVLPTAPPERAADDLVRLLAPALPGARLHARPSRRKR